MKKFLCIVAILTLACKVNAQDGKLRVGGNLGFTTNGGSSFVIGGDVDYLFNVESKFSVGGATGLIFIINDSFNQTFLPLAGSGRFHATNKIDLGLDMGYAIGLSNSGNGFYFRPMFEYKLGNGIALRASYSGIGSGGYLNAGAMFDL